MSVMAIYRQLTGRKPADLLDDVAKSNRCDSEYMIQIEL
jgi:hypothetical protein